MQFWSKKGWWRTGEDEMKAVVGCYGGITRWMLMVEKDGWLPRGGWRGKVGSAIAGGGGHDFSKFEVAAICIKNHAW